MSVKSLAAFNDHSAALTGEVAAMRADVAAVTDETREGRLAKQAADEALGKATVERRAWITQVVKWGGLFLAGLGTAIQGLIEFLLKTAPKVPPDM